MLIFNHIENLNMLTYIFIIVPCENMPSDHHVRTYLEKHALDTGSERVSGLVLDIST